MSTPPVARHELTALVFTALRGGIPRGMVGRGIAPQAGGWPSGEPGTGDFVEYAVLNTGPAQTPAPGENERVGARRTSWLFNYRITYHSINESSVDVLAYQGRKALVQIQGPFTLDGVEWTLQSVLIPQFGDTQRDDSTNPAHWRVTDAVSLHLSRSLVA